MKKPTVQYELPEFADNRELITFPLLVVVTTANDLGINIKAFGDGDNVIGNLFVHVDLHAVAHVEHLVHLFPRGPRLFLNQLEQGRNGEHIILHDVHVLYEIQEEQGKDYPLLHERFQQSVKLWFVHHRSSVPCRELVSGTCQAPA